MDWLSGARQYDNPAEARVGYHWCSLGRPAPDDTGRSAEAMGVGRRGRQLKKVVSSFGLGQASGTSQYRRVEFVCLRGGNVKTRGAT